MANKKTNEANIELWEQAEMMAEMYAKSENVWERELIFEDMVALLETYMQKTIHNFTTNAKSTGIVIPRADFESRVYQYLWNAVDAFEIDGKSSFKSIAKRRLYLAEKDVCRDYRRVGSESDKDGYSYGSARWVSLDKKVGGDESTQTLIDIAGGQAQSAELEFIESENVRELLSDYTEKNARYASVIKYMALGYEGDALAQVIGHGEKNDATMRKLTQRAKEGFRKFIEQR